MEKIENWLHKVGLEWETDRGIEKEIKKIIMRDVILLKKLKKDNSWGEEKSNVETKKLMTGLFLERGIVKIKDENAFNRTIGKKEIKYPLPKCVIESIPYFYDETCDKMLPMILETSINKEWLKNEEFNDYCKNKLEGYELIKLFDEKRADVEMIYHIKEHMQERQICTKMAELLAVGLLPIIEEETGKGWR